MTGSQGCSIVQHTIVGPLLQQNETENERERDKHGERERERERESIFVR